MLDPTEPSTPTTVTPPARSVLVNAINLVLFYSGWFACVLGLAWNWPLFGPASAAAVVGVHLALRPSRRGEALAIAAVVALGPLIEGTLALLGVAVFERSFWLTAPSLMALWAVFATTFDASLGWLATRPLLAVVFAAIGAPMSYYAAAQLQAVTLHPELWKWAVPVMVLWAIGFPLLLKLAEWIRTQAEVKTAA